MFAIQQPALKFHKPVPEPEERRQEEEDLLSGLGELLEEQMGERRKEGPKPQIDWSDSWRWGKLFWYSKYFTVIGADFSIFLKKCLPLLLFIFELSAEHTNMNTFHSSELNNNQ